MNQKIDKAIETMVGKIRQPTQPDEALKYSQAALNLTHVKNNLFMLEAGSERTKTKGAGS